MVKFENTFSKWTNLNSQLYNNCKAYLIDVLNKVPRNSILFYDCDENVCVPYDGGSHPEYASNVFSKVERVFLVDGTIYLDIEDANKYPITNINAESLYEIASMVKLIVDNDYDLGE